MSDKEFPQQNRSVSIGGSVTGGVIQTGDHDTASVQFHQEALPAPETVDIRAELAAIKKAVLELASPDNRKIQNAFQVSVQGGQAALLS